MDKRNEVVKILQFNLFLKKKEYATLQQFSRYFYRRVHTLNFIDNLEDISNET